jgi:uncharacterized protein with HEPN domain
LRDYQVYLEDILTSMNRIESYTPISLLENSQMTREQLMEQLML